MFTAEGGTIMPKFPANYRQLIGSERRPEPGSKLLGPSKDTDTIKVTVVLRRRPDGPPVPSFSHFRDTPPSHRRRLSGEEFARNYGADQGDIDKIIAFATAQGLTVLETHPDRRTMVLSGTVEEFKRAFHIDLNEYEHQVKRSRTKDAVTERYRGRDGFIHVPADLAEIIVGIFGLDNRRITKRNAGDPPGTAPIPVSEVTKLYDFPSNLAAGQSIAIFSEGGYLASDISANFGGSPPVVVDVPVDAPNGGFADPETTQDIFIAASAAPGATIAVYFTTFDQKGWVDLITRVIHPQAGDPVCSVLSSSFYVADGDDGPTLVLEGVSIGWLTAVSAAFEDAAIQGVTICIASGDSGAQSKLFDGKAHVQYPASDPWVLSVGGTTVGAISGSNFEEFAWNDSFTFGGFTGSGATGGGISDLFPQPSYQVDAGVPPSVNDGHQGRGVPDVSANASPNSGYPIILGGAPSLFPANGTSASAPLWAGLIAVLNAAVGENVGFVNPVLYALGSSVFRDIVAEPGATDNSFAGVNGYPVTAGWDACTGWGSPNGNALLRGLKHFFGPAIAVNLQDNLSFGTVCQGPKFRTLQIFNVGNRDLMVVSVQWLSGSTDFSVLPAPATPLAIAPGAQIDFTIEFNPTTRGITESATIRITSDDPVTPLLDVIASGFGGTGALETVIVDDGNFGDCCADSSVTQGLTLNNNGPCPLSIQNVTSSSSDFQVPSVSSYPLIVAAGVSVTLPIRFQPASPGAKSATITVVSSDPGGPKSVHVFGNAPAPKIAVTGSAFFGEVEACCHVERSIAICDVGNCKLHVSSVSFKHKSRHWKLVNNPFPATLHPGSCLAVVIRYQATERFPRPCELVIVSDDPVTPVKTVEVVACTIWHDCCGNCCGECRKGHCERHHCEPRCCKKCHRDMDDQDGNDAD
jgi:kumamolisin